MNDYRHILTMDSEERDQAKTKTPELVKEAIKHWNGGYICGQCKNFSQLGTHNGKIKHTSMNGACSLCVVSGLLPPETESCKRMESK